MTTPKHTPLKMYVVQRRRGKAASWENFEAPTRDLAKAIGAADEAATYAYPGVIYRVLLILPAPPVVVHEGRPRKRDLNRHSRSRT